MKYILKGRKNVDYHSITLSDRRFSFHKCVFPKISCLDEPAKYSLTNEPEARTNRLEYQESLKQVFLQINTSLTSEATKIPFHHLLLVRVHRSKFINRIYQTSYREKIIPFSNLSYRQKRSSERIYSNFKRETTISQTNFDSHAQMQFSHCRIIRLIKFRRLYLPTRHPPHSRSNSFPSWKLPEAF